MKNWISVGVLAILAIATQAQTTCVDPLACNFTELGECEFLDDNGMPCVTEGCAIPGACNFNPEADINDGSCEFTSCLGCTDEAACNYDPEAVYLDLSCIYFVDCNGVCGGDWIEDECGNCYEETLAPSGILTTFDFTGSLQGWAVPQSGNYEFVVAGAQGGNVPSAAGQNGTAVTCSLSLFQGDSLIILVGGQGQSNGSNSSGGGGGTFVVKAMSGAYLMLNGTYVEPLIVAGGGAGGFNSFTPNGVRQNINCLGGNGNGGGGAGGGFCSSGNAGTYGEGGSSFLEGGASVSGGGFGGGGGQTNSGSNISGGGGGWSGGNGNSVSNNNSSAGGSFIADSTSAQVQEFDNSGNGYVSVSYLGTIAPPCELGCVVDQACNFNPEATNDDGSCDFCFCGPGTEYDIELGQCMIVNGSSDINGDGCTNLGDLLDLLSGYGICNE